MAYRNLAKTYDRLRGPTAPRKRHGTANQQKELISESIFSEKHLGQHPLTKISSNNKLQAYEIEVKGLFDRIVPFLKDLSTSTLSEFC